MTSDEWKKDEIAENQWFEIWMLKIDSIISSGRSEERNRRMKAIGREIRERSRGRLFVSVARSVGIRSLWWRPTLAPPRPVYLFCSDQRSTLAEPQLLFSLAPGSAASANSFPSLLSFSIAIYLLSLSRPAGASHNNNYHSTSRLPQLSIASLLRGPLNAIAAFTVLALQLTACFYCSEIYAIIIRYRHTCHDSYYFVFYSKYNINLLRRDSHL